MIQHGGDRSSLVGVKNELSFCEVICMCGYQEFVVVVSFLSLFLPKYKQVIVRIWPSHNYESILPICVDM